MSFTAEHLQQLYNYVLVSTKCLPEISKRHSNGFFFEIESLWLFIFLNALDLLATQVPNN